MKPIRISWKSRYKSLEKEFYLQQKMLRVDVLNVIRHEFPGKSSILTKMEKLVKGGLD